MTVRLAGPAEYCAQVRAALLQRGIPAAVEIRDHPEAWLDLPGTAPRAVALVGDPQSDAERILRDLTAGSDGYTPAQRREIEDRLKSLGYL